MNKFSLKDKNIVVTGAAGILGRRFCLGLAEAGASLALIDLDQPLLNDLVRDLTQTYKDQKFLGYVCNVAVEAEVANAITSIANDFGQISVLINNAASKSSNLNDFFESFENYKLATWREVMSVNIDGMFLMAKYVGAHMIANKIKGSVIQTASVYGVVAPDQRIYEGSFYLGRQINTPAVYSVSKSAVIGLSNYLAAYWAPNDIRVNTLTPGGMESGQNETFKSKYSMRVPMGRMGQPDELVGALIYFASEASSYVTGQNLIVDGGLSSW